ncbi:MAG: PQQ-binding-like beta-propeller repeat protein [Candidatus Rifleibacteriota bacterium]
MSKRTFGVLLVIVGVLAFHLMGSEPETAPVWSSSISGKIYSDPVKVGSHVVFLGGDKGKKTYQLFEFGNDGKKGAESAVMQVLGYQPLACGKTVVLADKSNMLRGFTVPGLQIAWEAAMQQPILLSPGALANKNVIVASGRNTLFCVNHETGQPVWDYQFSKPLVNFGVDETVISVSGYTDVKDPVFNLMGHDPETGEVLWTLNEPASSDDLHFVQSLAVTTSPDGVLLVVDQKTGQLLFKHNTPGLKIAQVLEDRLILLAAGGSRIVCFSLMTGESWTTTLNSNFTGAARNGKRILLATKKEVRCVDADNGGLYWSRDLGDIYNAFPFRRGIFITHKDSFFDRATYGSYIGTEKASSIWTAYGRGIFQKPLICSNGDLAITYDGMVKMLPAPAESSSSIEMPAMPDPEARIRDAFNASATAVPETPEPANTASPPAQAGNSDDKKSGLPGLEVEESGWTNDKP